MKQCECYEQINNSTGGFAPICNGTKEREVCSCGGNKEKCDFYPEMRADNTINMNAIEFLKQKKRMCEYESAVGRGCLVCPIYLKFIKDNDMVCCDDLAENYPEEIVKIVYEWNKNNPELPTWNEWLHSAFNYYNGYGTTTFLEWLNLPITKDQAEHFNIPARKDL